MAKLLRFNGLTLAAISVLLATAILSAADPNGKAKSKDGGKKSTAKATSKSDSTAKKSDKDKAAKAKDAAEKPSATKATDPKAKNNPATPEKSGTPAAEAKQPAAKPAAPKTVKMSPERAALLAQVRQAKGLFDAGTQSHRDTARQAAAAAVEQLDKYLSAKNQPHGADWRDYLDLPRLQAETAKAKDFDAEVLTDSLARLNGGYDGLELSPFRKTAEALAEFLPTVAAADKATKADFEKTLDELADAIAAGGDSPDAATTQTIVRSVAWLNAHKQVSDLAAAVAQEYSQPNLLVDLNEAMIRSALSEPIEQVAPVRDCILGTSISGCGRTIGRLEVDFLESSEQAVILANFQGTNIANTVGHNRSAVICSRGETQLHGSKLLLVDENGIHGSTSTVSASVSTQITGIGSTKRGLMGRIVTRIAAKKAPQQKPQAEQIGARHAEARLLEQLDRTAGDAFVKSNSELHSRLRRPLLRFDAFPATTKFSSTADALHLRVLQGAHGRFAAPSRAPQFDGSGLVVRLHQSLVENTARQLFAGRTFDRDRLDDLARQFGGKPQPVDEDESPFSITFADDEPIAFVVDDGRVSISIRGKQFTSGEDHKPYDGMSITAHYAVESNGEALRLTREGDLEIHPQGFRPGVDKLTLSQTTFKRILQRKFDKMLPTEHVGTGVTPAGDLQRIGTFVVAKVRADDGWLSVDLARRAPSASARIVDLSFLEAE